jgi:hypothetical protein
VNTTVRTFASTASAAQYANFNSFTTVPTQGLRGSGANWDYARVASPAPCTAADSTAAGCALGFGNARNALDYQQPRTFQATVGLRF